MIVDIYKASGAEGIVRLNELLSDSDSVARAVQIYRKIPATAMHRASGRITVEEFDIGDGFLSVDVGRLMKEQIIQEADDTFTVDPAALTAAREFEEFLLHHDPEKVLSARGKRQKEPYGTDAGPASEAESNQPRVTGDENALPAQQPETPPTNE